MNQFSIAEAQRVASNEIGNAPRICDAHYCSEAVRTIRQLRCINRHWPTIHTYAVCNFHATDKFSEFSCNEASNA